MTKDLKAIYIELRVQSILLCELYARSHRKNYRFALDKYLEHYRKIEAELKKRKDLT